VGKLSQDINALIRESRGLDVAKNSANSWFDKTSQSTGDKSVESTSAIFRAGKIYIFRYESPKTEDKLEWWDRNPVVLSLGHQGGKDIGINLNLIPYARKLQLLDKIYEQYLPKIERMIARGKGDASSEDGIADLTYDKLKPFLEKTGFGAAVRMYITGLRTNSKVISYSKWKNLALIDLNDISGADINKAYSNIGKYIKKKKNK
jgi:hypothetical protein